MKTIKRILIMVLAVVMMAGALPVQSEAAGVKLNKSKATVYVGSSITLKLKGASGKVSWKSSNKKIVAVNSKGKVTGKKAGKATITAKFQKKSYKCNVTVKKPYLNSTKKTIYTGESYTLKLTGTKAASWKSSDKSVASVNAKGKVTARKAGKAVITCKGKDGKSYKCNVTVKEDTGYTASSVYRRMIKMKSKYPEGMHWTNDDFYAWKGGIYSGGYGCAGFAFMLSDAAFGDLPARTHKDFSNIRVGDIIRLDYDYHSVIVLEVKFDGVVVAEGNWNYSIHWGRGISFEEIKKTGTYVMTRYPE